MPEPGYIHQKTQHGRAAVPILLPAALIRLWHPNLSPQPPRKELVLVTAPEPASQESDPAFYTHADCLPLRPERGRRAKDWKMASLRGDRNRLNRSRSAERRSRPD